MTTAQLFDAARDAISVRGFDTEVQTGIALFLGAAKNMNIALLAAAELMPTQSIIYPFMHGQYCRELEFASLLTRVTRWSPSAPVYTQTATLISPLWKEWWRLQGSLGTLLDRRAAYRGLAFGHALLARVRLTPVIPDGADELDPFVAALRRIEQENGRMIQAQIRLLRDMPAPLAVPEREKIVEEEQQVVDEAFAGFLEWLIAGKVPPATAAPFMAQAGPYYDWWSKLLSGLPVSGFKR